MLKERASEISTSLKIAGLAALAKTDQKIPEELRRVLKQGKSG